MQFYQPEHTLIYMRLHSEAHHRNQLTPLLFIIQLHQEVTTLKVMAKQKIKFLPEFILLLPESKPSSIKMYPFIFRGTEQDSFGKDTVQIQLIWSQI